MVLRIGEVAAQAGVNVETLRYYERRGILAEPTRRSSGYRQYSAEAVQIVRFVKRAQELGFSLEEVQELLELRRNRGRSCHSVRQAALEKLTEIEKKLATLKKMKRALLSLVEGCDAREDTLECPLLEALEDPKKKSRS